MDKQTLEYAMLNHYRVCGLCKRKLKVHAYRKPARGKKEIVRCHCETKTCPMYMVETPKNEKDEVKK